METLDLILHPVRLRILYAMSHGTTSTTSDLCARLPDISKATVYRHVAVLVEGGLLDVAAEQRVHGAVERRYRLNRERAAIDGDTAAMMSLEDHRRAFAVAVAVLVAEFNTYLDRENADPTADSVGYMQLPLWLNQDELAETISEVRNIIQSRMDNKPSEDRSQYLVSPIVFPIAGRPQGSTDKDNVSPSTNRS